jgi:hypothetical protein
LLPIQNPLTNPLFDFYYESLASGELIALTCAAYESIVLFGVRPFRPDSGLSVVIFVKGLQTIGAASDRT